MATPTAAGGRGIPPSFGRGPAVPGRGRGPSSGGRGAHKKGRGSTAKKTNGNGPSNPTSNSKRSQRSRRSPVGGGGRGGGNAGGRAKRPDVNPTRVGAAHLFSPINDAPTQNEVAEEKIRAMTDQEVLIAFGPHVRANNLAAKLIHQEYLADPDQQQFIDNARKFLVEREMNHMHGEVTTVEDVERDLGSSHDGRAAASNGSWKEDLSDALPTGPSATKIASPPGAHWLTPQSMMQSIPTDCGTPLTGLNATKVAALPATPSLAPQSMMRSAPPGLRPQSQLPPPPGLHNTRQFAYSLPNKALDDSEIINGAALPRLPPGMMPRAPPQSALKPSLPGLLSPTGWNSAPPGMPPKMKPQSTAAPSLPTITLPPPPPMISMPPKTLPLPTMNSSPPNRGDTSSILPAHTTGTRPRSLSTASTSIRLPRIRRAQMRCDQQPGRLYANGVPASPFNAALPPGARPPALTVRPRAELTARWVLPLPFLRNRMLRKFEERASGRAGGGATPQNLTIRDALTDLCIGLFRRGAADSGVGSSIITKEILGSSNESSSSKDYFFDVDQRTDTVFGNVPFYSPRTPGNVVFRLYFEDNAHVTMATGPCMHVVPSNADIEPVLRFVLANFKTKKSNGVSSMHSLAHVLELFAPSSRGGKQRVSVAKSCLSEARKVTESAGANYFKKKESLRNRMEAEKLKDVLPDLNSLSVDSNTKTSREDDDANKKEEKTSDTKTKMSLGLISEEYNNEKRWREMQCMYAAILRAALSNEANHLLFRREVLANIRLKYLLWCPLIEAFAPDPFTRVGETPELPPGVMTSCPHPITHEHAKQCTDSRAEMQRKALGFVPCFDVDVPAVAAISKRTNGGDLFRNLSVAMKELYEKDYAVAGDVLIRREKVRSSIETVVSSSGDFPSGTKVAVFGSSANGFGSANSDLDLCLQIPSAANFAKEDGVEAMAKLAEKFDEAGMLGVDTARLTARIPIVKFNVPYPTAGRDVLVECDLSLQNPLAVLNTALLRAYSDMSPDLLVLASVIKRWAKHRDINDPSRHTLGSYGYVVMLLDFLTTCENTGDGFVVLPSAIAGRNVSAPILPNLQWVDPSWAQDPTAGPYRALPSKPGSQHCMIKHPTEPGYSVNYYFCPNDKDGRLKRYCSLDQPRKPSLGVLLASFFYYFAHRFDYKRHVVTLNLERQREREVKAEEDGWSLFKQGLAIEDPFELFYDVAHVVKVANFHHIRKELSLAYSKIVEAASGTVSAGDLINLICEPVGMKDDNS